MKLTAKERFYKALRKEKVDAFAIGSPVSMISTEVMDACGAYFPEAHTNPEKMALLAGAGHRITGFDNVMPVFSVVTESAAFDAPTDWGHKNIMPSTKEYIWKEASDINLSDKFLDSLPAQTVLKALTILSKEFKDNVSVTGKVFGPWTLGLHMFGIEDFLMWTITEPEKVKEIMAKLKTITLKFALAQIKAGADTICVGDHATRDLCSPETYRDFVLPLHKELAKEIPVPVMLHICGNTSDRIRYINDTGFAGFHYDSKSTDEKIAELASPKLALIGGTDNPTLMRLGTKAEFWKDIETKLKFKVDILGPECAVPLDTPLKNLKMFADYRKEKFGV
ncbi:MAG: hypothetical protein A2044_04265 [Candidatus Firestonebacteria bacterium GWA2_43_8]|nr:MAG: hypothetical protein A2044_04265 [Candidatus Firestonebacteria bacterium GWA2_43_8]